MVTKNFKNHITLSPFFFNTSFWLYLAKKKRVGIGVFFWQKSTNFLPQIWLLSREFYFRNVNLTNFGEKRGKNGWYDSN